MLSVVWGGRGRTCTVVKLLTRRGCKGELFGKRTKGELHVEGGKNACKEPENSLLLAGRGQHSCTYLLLAKEVMSFLSFLESVCWVLLNGPCQYP